MKKIPSLFKRDRGTGLIYNEVTPGCEWALEGGVMTAKWDGTAVKIEGGVMYKRYDAKHGKTPPLDFVPAQEPDNVTGHWPGWVPVTEQDKWHNEAFRDKLRAFYVHGTYELVGPKINGNPHDINRHILVPHGLARVRFDGPRTFESIRDYLEQDDEIEGIVFYRDTLLGGTRSVDPDGPMCKVKRKDYGLPWPVKKCMGEVPDAAL